ncbi:MAG TPA: DUF1592 domain-containing protein [Polyangiaceae bacterium]|nr:DUF1592 domain-containing protein [Polyangiaceae bacterium]
MLAFGCSNGADHAGLGSAGGASGGSATTGSSAGSAGLARGGDGQLIPSSPPASTLVPTPRLARLSRQQWSNTVRDLLKLSDIADIDAGVTGDALIGFDDEAEALFVTEQLRQQLADAAEKLAAKVIGDPAALARLVPADAPADLDGRARAFISSVGRRAFRRPLTEAEVTNHLALFVQGPTLYPGLDPFQAGVSLVLEALLQSPHFLYRTELGTAAPGSSKVALDDYEVAAKLAFALTNSMPDDELFAAAAAGQLRGPEQVAVQARRLLQGNQALAGFDNFNAQVYRLGTYDGISRDPQAFPDFTANAPAAMRREVLQFIDWVFSQDQGVKALYTTPIGFVNSSLAPLYGVASPASSDGALTKVDLDPSQRSGLLTQAGFLSSYITGGDPDIIHRGVFIATRLLCVTLPPPSPKATALIDLQPNMTNRERVEMTTGKGTCGEACHANLFNPLGYAFENYDAIGKYRTLDHGKPVNAADVYRLDGELKSFSNGVELSRALAEAQQLHSCYVQNMMTYLHGRPLAPDEQPTVDYYAQLSRAGVASLRDLELSIVTADSFLNRLP